MDDFRYQENRLHCEQVPLDHIAAAVGTPFYCYSEGTLEHHFDVFRKAFAACEHLICYSVKANGALAVLDALARRGSGFDIVSAGELERVRRIGTPGERIVFSGVGKTSAEIRAALEYGILLFNVESRAELIRLNTLAGQMGKKAPIALRINPDVNPATHPYISTGLARNKFGIPTPQAVALYRQAAAMEHILPIGLDCHIGSQLTTLEPFVDALRRIKQLLVILRGEGIPLRYLDLGGGLGIPYEAQQTPPNPERYASALLNELQGLEVILILEPGRVIVGNAGILVTRVEYIKQGAEKRFVITDAGMNDLIRPALYDAYHGILPVIRRFDREEIMADVVGPICETGDFFARDRMMPECHAGELLAIRSAGAYGFSMSSNYNTRPRAAEVMVRKDRFAVIRPRETLHQLLEHETLFSA
ncbi:MAG: diaminopimelate decarboxylase [Magnetococcales bacterium]|nr:diaminopimelate decarboxylase [Magnetococcales bacterium]